MKKSVIKRRKRVVPATAVTTPSESGDTVMDTTEFDRPSPPREIQRGTMNPDGSMNLGFRSRNDQGRTLPELSAMRPQQHPSSNPTDYASHTMPGSSRDPLDSLNNSNRLPPMTSYPSPNRPSLSPNSFLSPSRKRSFASLDQQQQKQLSHPDSASGQNQKRLSSIKSILNPGYTDLEASGGRLSPYHAPSPGLTVNYPASPSHSGMGGPSDQERAKLERREMLQREAEHMREALKAKEQELQELGDAE